jgi:hypothetical protein
MVTIFEGGQNTVQTLYMYKYIYLYISMGYGLVLLD